MTERIEQTAQVERAYDILSGLTYGSGVMALAKMSGYEGHALGLSSEEHLNQLADFAASAWDFRNGKERWESGSPEYSKAEHEEIFGQARDIAGYNLVDSTWLKEPVGIVSVLGGGNDAGLVRIRYAEANTKRFDVPPKDMYLLGSARLVTDAERPKTDTFAPEARTEYDLMNAAFRNVYNGNAGPGSELTINDTLRPDELDVLLSDDPDRKSKLEDQHPDYWAYKVFLVGGTVTTSLLAPQVEGERRANTADSMRMLRDMFGNNLKGKNIGASTHAMYTAFQDIDLLRMIGLPLGISTSTFGFDAGYSGTERKPHQLLQETKSAIDSAVRLNNSVR